jgi:hypothetical protein
MLCSWETVLSNEAPSLGCELESLPRGMVPPRDSVFEAVSDAYGLRLALVFGNHARGGLCPYYPAGHCHHCDIGAGEGFAFDSSMNHMRLVMVPAALRGGVGHTCASYSLQLRLGSQPERNAVRLAG